MVEATQDEKYENYIYEFGNVVSSSLGNQVNLLTLGRAIVEPMMSALVPNSTLASKVATPVKVEVSSTVSVPFTVVAEPGTDISTAPPAKVIFPVVGENTLNAPGVGVLRRSPPNVLVLENVCHLYTSPSPRDLSTYRMPSSA